MGKAHHSRQWGEKASSYENGSKDCVKSCGPRSRGMEQSTGIIHCHHPPVSSLCPAFAKFLWDPWSPHPSGLPGQFEAEEDRKYFCRALQRGLARASPRLHSELRTKMTVDSMPVTLASSHLAKGRLGTLGLVEWPGLGVHMLLEEASPFM